MQEIYLLTGTNLGIKPDNLSRAKSYINRLVGPIHRESSIYETAAWGFENQENFLNQALMLKSEIFPEKLLVLLKKIEQTMGRAGTVKWGPRAIDIDILFVGNSVIETENLCVPHRNLQRRNFALIPLTEIAPELFHPVLKKTVTQLLMKCGDENWVKIFEPNPVNWK